MAQVSYAQQPASFEIDTAPRLRISVEVLAYSAILILALVLRVLALDVLPLDNAEAHEALAALHRIDSNVPSAEGGNPILPSNSLGAFFNSLFMMFLGTSDAVARLPTALAGVGLAFTPLLYRRYLGRMYPLLLSLGLAINPVSIIASRTMSGVLWAMLLVMIGGWFLLRFVETRERNYALGTSICIGGVLFLTTPIGILIMLGLFFGVVLAALLSDPDSEERRLIPETATLFPGFESFVAAGLAAVIITTIFFLSPGSLSSLGQIPQAFLDGLTTRQAGVPIAYGLWSALRYDMGFLVFGLISMFYALRDGGFRDRFLSGWLLWGLVSLTVYPGATPDMALLVSLPAVMLTISFLMQMLTHISFGYWQVPAWVLPLHAVVVAGLLASTVVNLQAVAVKLADEAKIVDFAKVLDTEAGGNQNVHFGTLKADAGASSMAISLPITRYQNCGFPETDEETVGLVQMSNGEWCEPYAIYDITIRLYAIDRALREAEFTIKDIQGNLLYGPEPIGDGITYHFTAPAQNEYRLDVNRTPELPIAPLQYGIIVEAENLMDDSFLESIRSGASLMDTPRLWTLLLIGTRGNTGGAPLAVLMMLLFLPITFFLTGSFYGARAARRGIGLGVLLFVAVYGMAVGWQAAVEHGDDVREFWHLGSVAPDDYRTLRQTLQEMSQRDNGTGNEIEITVQGRDDAALAWALRDFPRTEYVEQVGLNTATAIVITPDITQRPALGADYVGRRLVFDYAWDIGSLNWTDFGGWLFTRRSRIEPQQIDLYRLWVRKDVYGVETVPGQ